MRMLGQTATDANKLFAWAAASPCDDLRKPCLERQDLLNMAGCLTRTPPEGVEQKVYDAWCHKIATCGLFDTVGCEPEASELANELYGEPSDCLTAEQVDVLDYCAEHGHRGPDRDMNVLCWAMHVTPDRSKKQRAAPICADAIDCLDRSMIGAVGRCLQGKSCPSQAWLDSMLDIPVCPELAAEMREEARAFVSDGCLPQAMFDDVVYCLKHGMDGPDAQRNSTCYAMTAIDMLDELARMPLCGNGVTPRQQSGRSGGESAEVETPVTTPRPGVPSAEEEQPVDPTLATPRAPTATEPEPTYEREPEEGGLSKGWMIGGGLALAAVVGAGVYFARKK